MRLVRVHDHGRKAAPRRFVVVMRDIDDRVRAFTAERRPKDTADAEALLRSARS
jgi:hypothetical protein